MNEQEQLNVCPKCGAYLNDGVCKVCGYEVPVQTTEVVPQDTGGRFSGMPPVYNGYNNTQNTYNAYNAYNNNSPYQNGGSVYYGADQYSNSGSNAYDANQYSNGGNNAYGAGQYQNNENNAYGAGQYQNNASNAYGSSMPYSNSGNVYGSGQFDNNNNPYGKIPYQGNANQYGSNPYGGNPYGNNQYGGNQYQYGAYNNPIYDYNNPYSPYAAPQKKKYTGLIIGVIITVIVLFLIALFALFYHAFDALNEKENNNRYENYDDFFDYYYDDYDDDYYYDYDYDYDDDYSYDYDPYDDYDYDYDYDHDYDSDEYYTFHDDIKEDLSYEIDWEEYSYDTDNENVLIYVDYPVIVGKNVPNIDKLNETIAEEVSTITEYYEDDYAKYMLDDDDYFYATSKGYVTYMREDILSIAFDEYIITSDYYGYYNIYCINIDMKDGVILDNTGIIDVNDDFSVDFRKRSDTQNGTINELTWMTDQEITRYLTSEDNLIIFYTPQGLEVGFNYDDGWVTVTYKDYEDFLKIF